MASPDTSRLPLWRRLARNRLLDLGAGIVALVSILRLAIVLPHQAAEHDFAHYYTWSHMLREGHNPYTTPLASWYARYGLPFQPETPVATYPPTLLWLFAPFTFLSPRGAFAAWLAVQVASLGTILWLTHQVLGDRVSARGWRFIVAAVLASTPLYIHLISSQIQLTLAVAVVGAFVMQRSGRQTAACLAITVAGLVKLFPFVLLPWFIWRAGSSLRRRLVSLAASLAAIVFGVLVSGPSLWSDFVHHSAPVLRVWAMQHLFNYTLPSFVLHLGYWIHGFQMPPSAAGLWWTAGLSLGLLAIALAYTWCLATARDPEAELGLLCCAMLGGVAAAWEHYLVFLFFPAAVAAARVAARPTGRRVAFFALTVLALDGLIIGPALTFHDPRWLVILLNYFPLYGLLALGGFFAAELRAPTPRGAVPDRFAVADS